MSISSDNESKRKTQKPNSEPKQWNDPGEIHHPILRPDPIVPFPVPPERQRRSSDGGSSKAGTSEPRKRNPAGSPDEPTRPPDPNIFTYATAYGAHGMVPVPVHGRMAPRKTPPVHPPAVEDPERRKRSSTPTPSPLDTILEQEQEEPHSEMKDSGGEPRRNDNDVAVQSVHCFITSTQFGGIV